MEFLKKYSITPQNIDLYKLAFVHESFSNENDMDECYERLEFLGDAVLDLVVSEYLYRTDSTLNEGQLTRIRSNYVCKKALYTYSMELGLNRYIKLGSSLNPTKRETDSIISDVFESFVGALFLDLGLEVVEEFLNKTVIPHIKNDETFFYDYKSEIKELCDQKGFTITYELIFEEGEPHNKTFTMEVFVEDICKGKGIGGSKKEAEQNAAKVALKNMKKDSQFLNEF